MVYIDNAGHEPHLVYTTTFASIAATDPSFACLDELFCLAADPVLVPAQHADTLLLRNFESGIIPRQPELELKLDKRHAWRMTGNQVRTPKPDRKRCVCVLSMTVPEVRRLSRRQ